MINELQLKQLGFKKINVENEWTWGSYTLGHLHEPILHYNTEKQQVASNIASMEGYLKILKKVTIVKEIEEVMNMASFVLSKK